MLSHISGHMNPDLNVKHSMKLIPAISVMHGRIVVVDGGRYEYLRTPDGKFRNLVNAIQELQGGDIFVLDIDGLERSSPNLGLIKKIAAYKNVWMDAGIQDIEDMMDLFVNDAEYAIIGTKSIKNLDEPEQAAELSDKVIFSIDYDDGIISPDRDVAEMTIRQIAETVRGFRGLHTVIFMDLGSHRNKSKIDINAAISLTEYFRDVYVSASLTDDDENALNDAGIKGIIRDFRMIGDDKYE